jgi:hypothetical protein
MRTDEEQFLTIAGFNLSIVWFDDGATLFCNERVAPPAQQAVAVAKGPTLDNATNAAVGRRERKHRNVESQ